MGFLGRSKSLRRQQSSATTSKHDRNEEERFYKQRVEQRSALNVSIAQPSYHTGSSLQRDEPRQTMTIRPATAHSRPQRACPLPTPDKDLPNPLGSHIVGSHIRTQTIEIKADAQVYRFPTPVSTPRMSPHQNSWSNSSDATIGIALGSPRLAPPQHILDTPRMLPTPARASPLRTFSDPARTPMTATPIAQPAEPVPTKLRKSKSRTLKSMFSSSSKPKPHSNEQPSVMSSQWQSRSNSIREDPAVRSQSSNTTVTSSSIASWQSESTYAPSISKLATTPATRSQVGLQSRPIEVTKLAQEYGQSQPIPQTPKPKAANMQIFPTVQTLPPIQRGRYTEIRIPHINQDALERINNGTVAGSQQSSLLNVNIPKSEMDRYSVMFEKLLKPTTSIAERRGTLQRLRPLAEETALHGYADSATLRRRATSPSMPSRPSPGLVTKPSPKPSPSRAIIERSIQETNKHHHDAASRLLQMHRSRTVPAPSANTLLAPEPPVLSNPPRDASPTSPLWSEASLPITPDSSVGHTFFSIDDDDSNDEGARIFNQAREIPRIREPSPEPFRPKRMDSLDPQDRGSPPPQTNRPQTNPQVQYGQVGLARTVSLSRAKSAKHTPVAVKQPLRPRVVDMDTRKSTLVLIEQA